MLVVALPDSAGDNAAITAIKDAYRDTVPPAVGRHHGPCGLRRVLIPLRRQFVADRSLYLDGLPHRRPRHHALVMRGQMREFAGLRHRHAAEPPEQPEQMDVGDRVAPDAPSPVRPTAARRSPNTLRECSSPCRRAGWTVAAMNDIHETTRASASTSSVWQQPCLGKATGEIEQYAGDLGQRPAIDQQASAPCLPD